MWPCSICSNAYRWTSACDRVHQGVRHDCHQLNLSGNQIDSQPHPAPPATPPLSPREHQAVAAYQRRVLALVGPRPLVDLVTEERER